jgi:hypothetical protein
MEMTAVTFLVKKLPYFWYGSDIKIIQQDREREKQQIVKAAASAYEDMFGTNGTEYGEKYYDKITQEP